MGKRKIYFKYLVPLLFSVVSFKAFKYAELLYPKHIPSRDVNVRKKKDIKSWQVKLLNHHSGKAQKQDLALPSLRISTITCLSKKKV